MSPSFTEKLARWEARWRPRLGRLPPPLASRLYSTGRRLFLGPFARRPPSTPFVPPPELARDLWGLRFRSPLFNAAGMFKNGDGYALAARQGAGAYLAGTTTARPRTGNLRRGIKTPFAPYPASHAASNWLGLPNDGHAAVAHRLFLLERIEGCPVGASVAADPDPALDAEQKVEGLVEGLRLYQTAGVDFLEMNESCPNTEAAPEDFAHLEQRLRRVADLFLRRRVRDLPLVVKFSNDTDPAQVPRLVGLLLDLGYDGVNFGNTSVAYAALRGEIAAADQPLYDFFTGAFGGGVSGRPLRERSARLGRAAVAVVRERGQGDFHVWRTGGIETPDDLATAAADGVALCQWYTGYFEAFARDGHHLYRRLYGAGNAGSSAQAG